MRAMGKSMAKSSGEGSRGGHVIGHTKGSNRPIYAASHESYTADNGGKGSVVGLSKHGSRSAVGAVIKQHKNYDEHDHMEAFHAHKGEEARLREEVRNAPGTGSMTMWHPSQVSAQNHRNNLIAEADAHGHVADAHLGASIRLETKRRLKEQSAQKSMAKSGGEGSRGGHIIGRTRAGRPIYGSSHPFHQHALRAEMNDEDHDHEARAGALYQLHRKYTAQDHADAVDAHHAAAAVHEEKSRAYYQAAGKASGKKREHLHAMGNKHGSIMQFHLDTARGHQTAAAWHHEVGSPAENNRAVEKSMAKSSKGPGSRGGHILGTTRSGKPVYAGNSHAHYGKDGFAKQHKHFTRQDHLDAIDMHDQAANGHNENAHVAAWEHEGLTGESGYRSGHHDMSEGAGHAARLHRQAAFRMNKSMAKSGGEGSRGGRVVGHLKNGKPVYEKRTASHLSYDSFTPKEHKEAAGVHEKEAKLHAAIYANNMKHNGTVEDAVHAKRAAETHNRFAQAHHAMADKIVARRAKAGAQIDALMERQTYAGIRKSSSGEGSRGGKVIGHTKSSKPIYAASHSTYHTAANKKGESIAESIKMPKDGYKAAGSLKHMVEAVRAMHHGWTAQDHRDAAEAHGRGKWGLTLGDAHHFAANVIERHSHPMAKKNMAKSDEGFGDSAVDTDHCAVDALGGSAALFMQQADLAQFPTMWAPIASATKPVN